PSSVSAHIPFELSNSRPYSQGNTGNKQPMKSTMPAETGHKTPSLTHTHTHTLTHTHTHTHSLTPLLYTLLSHTHTHTHSHTHTHTHKLSPFYTVHYFGTHTQTLTKFSLPLSLSFLSVS